MLYTDCIACHNIYILVLCSVQYGKKPRYNANWLNNHTFLRYSQEKYALYCVYCSLFPHRDGRDKSFTLDGPKRDWHHIGKVIATHVGLKGHEDCIVTAESFLATTRHLLCIRGYLVMTEIIKVLLLCGRQNIAIRGHTHEKSNFMAILLSKAENNAVLANHLVKPKIVSSK